MLTKENVKQHVIQSLNECKSAGLIHILINKYDKNIEPQLIFEISTNNYDYWNNFISYLNIKFQKKSDSNTIEVYNIHSGFAGGLGWEILEIPGLI